MNGNINRRRFGVTIGGALASLALDGACRRASEPRQTGEGRITARPRPNGETSAAGAHPLGLDRTRDAILHIPTTSTITPLPLLVLFHGAGENAESVLRRVGSALDESGVAVLAPDSRGSSRDAIRGSFGRDVAFVNRALELAFDSVAVDPTRIAVGGFSDGATYALSLGLINGDLFRRVIAFSPGFVVERAPHGSPRFFISHGTEDPILPIDRCGRLIVAGLQRRGYDVTFREFEGGHEIPPDIAREGSRWVAEPSAI